MRKRWLIVGLLTMLVVNRGSADGAIEWTGKKHPGRFLQAKHEWIFRTTGGKDVALADLQQIRFAEHPVPLAKAPLTHTLHWADGQRVTGVLKSVDGQRIDFLASWGKEQKFDRSSAVAIVHANDAVPILREDFEADLKAWQIEGKPRIDPDRSYFGKGSLRLDAPKQRLERAWKPELRDGSVRLFFFDADPRQAIATTFDLLQEKPAPRVVLDADGYRCDNVKTAFAALKRSAGWHQLAIDIEAGRLRVFVDDHCLGEGKTEALLGVRIAHAAGEMWIDELSVTRKLQPMALPLPTDQDAVWLEQGEQLFGRILAADESRITLQAKFGKRVLPWPRVRGILFAQSKKPPPSTDPEIRFAPGPGISLDSLRGKLVRWDGEKLVIAHAQFGEVALERARLHSIRFLAK